MIAPSHPDAASEVLAVYAFYVELARDPDPENGLGGKLLYAGALDREGCRLVRAANIAGAASLSAAGDAAVQRQVIREGVADFMVTSLDEAVRILKNEIRKHQEVAVCAGIAPEQLEREMRERGIVPDLVRPSVELHAPRVASALQPLAGEPDTLLSWSIAAVPARWMPKLDAIALELLPPDAGASRRWLRLAARYLDRNAQGVRVLRVDRGIAANFLDRVRDQVETGAIAVPISIRIACAERCDEYHLGAAPRIDQL